MRGLAGRAGVGWGRWPADRPARHRAPSRRRHRRPPHGTGSTARVRAPWWMGTGGNAARKPPGGLYRAPTGAARCSGSPWEGQTKGSSDLAKSLVTGDPQGGCGDSCAGLPCSTLGRWRTVAESTCPGQGASPGQARDAESQCWRAVPVVPGVPGVNTVVPTQTHPGALSDTPGPAVLPLTLTKSARDTRDTRDALCCKGFGVPGLSRVGACPGQIHPPQVPAPGVMPSRYSARLCP